MTERKKAFINVDELMPQVSLEQVALHYGVVLPELRQVGAETRSRCFLSCGKQEETGDRALAIQTGHPAKQWACHQYGCGKNGNLVSLCDFMKSGASANGRPRGDRFKEIASDLLAIVEGRSASGLASPVAESRTALGQALNVPRPPANVPLKDSENERARGLVNLDAKFLTDVSVMSPKASAYFRRRPYLTPEVCRKWRMGYLPRDVGGEDKSGGTMRGKVVYGYCNADADVLTWFGRDPEFEEKHQKWEAAGKVEREPEKFHFVKGFHRGQELFGVEHFDEESKREAVAALGVILVEGPNGVIRLDTLGIPSLGLCSNMITREQAAKAATLARERSGGIVTVFLDCDAEGENGMKQCLGYLAQLTPVRLAWTSKMYGGKFRGRQPESLTIQEWQEIEAFLRSGHAPDWSLDDTSIPR